MSNKLSEQLIELHVKHELARLSPSEIEKDIANEIDAFLRLASKIKLKELVSIDQISNISVPHLEGSPKLDKAIKNIVLAIYEDKVHEKTSLGDLIQQTELEEVIDKALEFKELREELLGDALNSNIAKEVITDLLYSGISRYIAQTNALTKKVPGAKAMMKLGKGILSNAAPALESRVEHQIKKTIGIALPEIIAQSEKFISNSISDEGIKDIALSVWNGLEDQPISSVRKHVDADAVEELTEMILGQIHRIGGEYNEENPPVLNTYAQAIFQSGLKAFYKEYGNKKLSALMKDIGLSADELNQVVTSTLPTLVENLKESGFLEERLRARLSDFYLSKDALNLLG